MYTIPLPSAYIDLERHLTSAQARQRNSKQHEEHKIVIKQRKFFTACAENDISYVKRRLKKRLFRTVFNTDYCYNSQTPLCIAAINGHKEIVEILVNSGASINFKNDLENTALLEATLNNQTEIVEFLLMKKASINPINKKAFSALHAAAFMGSNRVLEFLLPQCTKEQINAFDSTDRTPLHIAIERGMLATVLLLLEHDANFSGKVRLKLLNERSYLALGEVVNKLSSLEELNLSGNHLGKSQNLNFSELGNVLHRCPPALKTIDLSGNHLDSLDTVSFHNLGNALVQCRTLNRVILKDNNLNDTNIIAFKKFCTSLRQCQNLYQLEGIDPFAVKMNKYLLKLLNELALKALPGYDANKNIPSLLFLSAKSIGDNSNLSVPNLPIPNALKTSIEEYRKRKPK
jgi:ankyrin repeat protein